MTGTHHRHGSTRKRVTFVLYPASVGTMNTEDAQLEHEAALAPSAPPADTR